MKRFIRETGRFFRSFWITALAFLCPMALIGGIVLADRNTRSMAFNSAEPAIAAEQTGDGTEINVFGYTLYIPDDLRKNVSFWAGKAQVLIPAPLRLDGALVQGAFETIKKLLCG